MSRRFKQDYLCSELDELARQLIRAPADKREEQVRRAERLHDEIDPDATYPLDYLSYRITGYRVNHAESVLLVGQAVKPDLRLLIDSLSRSLDMSPPEVPPEAPPEAPPEGSAARTGASPPPEAEESFESAKELAKRLNISTKTIDRWRRSGLRWRWVYDPQAGKRRVLYERRAVERFIREHQHRVERAAAFTPIPEVEKQRLLDRARRIATSGATSGGASGGGRDVSLNRVALHLARRTGRSHEAVRQLLFKHEEEYPDDRIFDRHTEPLTPRQKRLIARAARMGVPLDRMARRFNKTRETIRRATWQVRLERVARRPMEGHELPTFRREDADQVLLHSQRAQTIEQTEGSPSTVPVQDLPTELQPLYRQATYDPQTLMLLFTRYNYLKFRARQLRESINPSNPRARDVEQLEWLIEQANRARHRLVLSGLPTVLSVARRQRLGWTSSRASDLTSMLEAGHAVLFEAVEEYDPSRGRAFEAFLTNQLLKRFVTLSEAAGARAATARRRESGERVLERLIAQAREAGIELLPRL